MKRHNGKAEFSKANTASQFRLGFLIHDVSRLRRTVIDKALKPLGITRSQWWVLSNLARNASHEMMQTELANVLDVGKVALGGLLDRLEASGYIERKSDLVDRRAKRIAMTKKGEQVLGKMQSTGLAVNAETLCDISPAEIRRAEDILHRMKAQLIEMDAKTKRADAV